MCPNCNSEFLMIKHKTFWERVVIFLTNKRKYTCRDCNTEFRAPERRLLKRHERHGSRHRTFSPDPLDAAARERA
ncbi:MAG: hypothetical protein JWN34_4856 [Bryobacterales bacterium]|jgi:DNA-directed RNA polymerase subunit RPC12/RpoP|nr:hypothetical protein [Bryobacterales bacterium]